MTNYRDILRPYEVGIRVYSKVNITYFNILDYAYITKKPYFNSKHLKNLHRLYWKITSENVDEFDNVEDGMASGNT